MGTKGPKAGNIYSSLKSRGLIGGKGKDPMLNCGSPFKVTDEKDKEKNKDNNSSQESNVGYVQDNEGYNKTAKRILSADGTRVLATREDEKNTPAKFTEKGLSRLKAADIGGEFGRIIDINNSDYSFTLEIEMLYDL